jgi:hypothetical protein
MEVGARVAVLVDERELDHVGRRARRSALSMTSIMNQPRAAH